MRASDIISALKVFSYMPGSGTTKDFHIVFSENGQASAHSGILYTKVNFSLGIGKTVALSWKRFSSLLSTLGTKDIEFIMDGDTLKWKSEGPSHKNNGTFSYINPSATHNDINIKDNIKSIHITDSMRKVMAFLLKSTYFENYTSCRGIVIMPHSDHIVMAATDGISLGISKINDFSENIDPDIVGAQILVSHPLSKLIAGCDTLLDSRLFCSFEEDGKTINGCGVSFNGGFVVSAVEAFKNLDFEKHYVKFIEPLKDVPYLPFDIGIKDTIARVSVFDDGWSESIVCFTQKDGELTISSESAFGSACDVFTTSFKEEQSLKCLGSLLKEASSVTDGMYPIHLTNGAFVFSAMDRNISLIVSPYNEQ